MLGSLILVGGSLGDVLGEKRVFVIGIAGFGADVGALRGGARRSRCSSARRALQGIFGALLTPASLAIIVAAFPPDERGKAIGTWTAYVGHRRRGRPARRAAWLVDAARLALDLRDQRPVRRS